MRELKPFKEKQKISSCFGIKTKEFQVKVKIYTERDSKIGICQTQRRDFERLKNRSIFEDKYGLFFSRSKARRRVGKSDFLITFGI